MFTIFFRVAEKKYIHSLWDHFFAVNNMLPIDK